MYDFWKRSSASSDTLYVFSKTARLYSSDNPNFLYSSGTSTVNHDGTFSVSL